MDERPARTRADHLRTRVRSWLEDLWQSLLRILDPGTMSGDIGWGRRLLALLVTIFGLLIAGTLIGLIAAGVEQRVEAMKRGRSEVVERDHIVILGASAGLTAVIEQLALAGRERSSNVLVVLADQPPIELEDAVRALRRLGRTRVVVRSGDPGALADLELVRVRDARTVVVLRDPAQRDAGVVRSVLAVGTALGGFGQTPIIAELTDPATAASLVRACGPTVHPVAVLQAMARITAFGLRQAGLQEVVDELLDFEDVGIHVRDPGILAGRTFAESVFWYARCRPIGRMRPDGEVEINPDPQTRLDPADRIVLLAGAEPDPTRSTAAFQVPDRARVEMQRTGGSAEERLLIIGWNALGAQLLTQVDLAAAPSSQVTVAYDCRLLDGSDVAIPTLDHVDVTLVPTTSQTVEPELVDRAGDITSILVLGYRTGLAAHEADARTLLDLLLLRRHLDGRSGRPPRLVVELVDGANRDLAMTLGADGCVVRDILASRMIAQLAEQPERRAVLLHLYGSGGQSVHLVPATELGLTGAMTFAEVVAVAYSMGMLAIGWRLVDGGAAGRVRLNPRDSDRAELGPDDKIVLITGDRARP